MKINCSGVYSRRGKGDQILRMPMSQTARERMRGPIYPMKVEKRSWLTRVLGL